MTFLVKLLSRRNRCFVGSRTANCFLLEVHDTLPLPKYVFKLSQLIRTSLMLLLA
jgi:hypothetical protein